MGLTWAPSSSSLSCHVPIEQIDPVRRALEMSELRFCRGIEIFRQGDLSDLAYTVVSGQVEIVVDGVVLALLGPGDVFGEMGLVDEAPRSATARTLGDVVLDALSHDEFTKALTTDPDTCLHYLRSLFERLRSSNAHYVRGAKSAPSPEPALEPAPEAPMRPVMLVACTPESRAALGAERVEVTHYPFKIGRRSSNPFGANDLLLDDRQPYQISRNHVSLSEVDGKFMVRDRGSFLGAIVNGAPIGGKQHKKAAELTTGDNALVLGATGSPFEFVVRVDGPRI